VKFYYENVPGIGNVAVSRHAQERVAQFEIQESAFAQILTTGETIPDGECIIRQIGMVRIVILLKPTPFRGAALVKTVYLDSGRQSVRR
jgi:hypothetical protein